MKATRFLFCLAASLSIVFGATASAALAARNSELAASEKSSARSDDKSTTSERLSGTRDRDRDSSSGSGGERVAKIDEQFVIGKVLSVTAPKENTKLMQATGMVSNQQMVHVQILEGPLKGTDAVVDNEMTDNPAFNVEVKPGQEVVLSMVTESGGKPEFNIADYHRAPVLCWLLIVFLITFLVFGGKNGLKSLAGLVISVLLISLVLLPLSMTGFNPLLTAVFICLIATSTSMLLVAGLSKKALASILGTIGGVIIAGVAAQLVIALAPLTGLSSEEAQILRGSVLNQPPTFYSGLLAAGMLIGALGVIMDVGISVASAVQEVAKTGGNLTAGQLYESGMNVGRDIMGTMTNTLILAYTGSALPLLLLAAQMPSIKLLNLDLVATEIASALSGSLGLICTIPLTALAAAKLMSTKQSEDTLGAG
ncbi:MAG TPA: YibE/F family protein [Drouetiella sp.]